MLPRLVYIEGLSGSGKSTIAQHLALHLQRLGHSARWVYEHESPHTIANLTELREPGGIDRALDRWRALCADLAAAADTVIVFDGVLFQVTAGALQLMGIPEDRIRGTLKEIEEIVAPTGAAVVYLTQPDVRAAIRRIRAARGEWYEQYVLHQLGDPGGDMETVIEFFERHSRLADAIFSNLSLAKQAIDSSGHDWESYRRRIGAFLSIPPIATPYRIVEHADDYAGRYRNDASLDEMGVVSEGEHLFLDDAGRTRLIPVKTDAFLIEGMGAEMWFQRDARRFELRGQLPGVGTTWTKM